MSLERHTRQTARVHRHRSARTIRRGVWNAGNGQLLAKLEGHTASVRQVGFSPDGQRVVTASGDRLRGCGTRPTANCWPRSKVTRALSCRWGSHQTGSALSPPATT